MKKAQLLTPEMYLNQLQFKVFDHADSLDEARDNAYSALPDSPKCEIDAVLDRYHNTLIETVKRATL